MKIALRAAAFCALLILQNAAWAGFEEGVEAYKQADYTRAMTQFLPLAKEGHPKAQFILGVMFTEGQGAAKDEAQAAHWYGLAAAQGHSVAQERLALAYLFGRGVKQSDKQAAKWFTRSAEQGEKVSLYYLGSLYENGRGVHADNETAYALYTLALGQIKPDMAASMRQVLTTKMDVKQVFQAQARADAWKVGMPLPVTAPSK